MRKILFSEYEKDVARFILELLGTGVVLTTALLAPGAVGVFGKAYLKLQSIPRTDRSKTLYELKRRGLVQVERGDEGERLVLTKKGRARLQKYELQDIVIDRPRVWDGNWRIVFFDVPKKPPALNRARDIFRDALKRLGFTKIQKSVWVHPFPCEDEIAYIVELYGLQPYVRVAVAKSVTGEERLRQKFDL